jgi:pimeloyl-ACP methyl ester carboxylesterase
LVGQRAHQHPLLIALALLAGCAGGQTRDMAAAEIARAAGLEPAVFATATFDLQGWRRDDGRPGPLFVYIEGDGFAYVDERTPSSDPTPRDPVALRLAAADPAAAILYLGRPCQFAPGRSDRRCTLRDWTVDRFSEPAVDAIDRAIGQQRRPIVLVGYSGGGVIAALLATRRRDVERVVAIAAPLDLDRWTKLSELSPLRHEVIGVRVPLVALAGERDSTVPAAVATLPGARQIVVPGFDHRCCWARDWPQLLKLVR